MEKKKNEQKTAQILYITIILALLVMAIAVGLTTAAGRRKPAESTAVSDKLTEETVGTSNTTVGLPIITRQTVPASSTEASTARTAAASSDTTAAKAAAAEALVPEKKLPLFILPTIGSVSKTYSADLLVWSNTMEDYRAHMGIDICAAAGDAVMAAADGIVSNVYEDPMMGYTVVISHDGDSESFYKGLAKEITVSAGDKVKSGEVIGAVGESAIIEIAEEPHLHFEMRVNGESVNPLDYISKATMTTVENYEG